ncbi:MAG: hypothetical protein ACE5GY_06560, partial [Thermodesulfobacteriota bacterium]
MVEVELDPDETVIAEAGAKTYVEEGIQFEAKMEDGSATKGGFFDKVLGAGNMGRLCQKGRGGWDPASLQAQGPCKPKRGGGRPMKWKLMAITALVAAMTALSPGRADAGCNINITATNTGHERAFIDPLEAKVKIKGGTWKKMFANIAWPTLLALEPGERLVRVYKAFFGCKKKRRYKFVIWSYPEGKPSCGRSFYIPGPNSFTTSTNIDLGDLRRFACRAQDGGASTGGHLDIEPGTGAAGGGSSGGQTGPLCDL